jgi:hypothetical protein
MPVSPEFAPVVIAFGEKFQRACEHLKALDDAAELFSKEQGNPGFLGVGELNSQRTKYLLKIQQIPDPPTLQWGVIIGDAVHCLRSALDQLATALWTDKPTSATRFPICRTTREWVVDAPRMYWSVPSDYVAAFNRAQPYHRGDAANMHPLAILNELWNLDKHRAVPAAALVSSHIDVTVEKAVGVSIGRFRTFPGRPLKKGTVIAEATFTHDGHTPDPDVHLKANARARVGFGTVERASSISGKPVSKTFEDLLGAVSRVLQDIVAVHSGEPFSTQW